MEAPSSGSHRLKLHRALEHLNALRSAQQGWAEREACLVVDECEIETRKHISRIRIFEQPSDPAMPLLIGDVAHNLRQSLDHLAYRLAVVVTGSDPPPNEDSTQFPIASEPSRFDGGVGNKIGPRNRMPAGMYAALEGFQPYNGGKGELLAILHALDNLDKHRFPPLIAGIGSVDSLDIRHMAVSQFRGPRIGALKDRTPVLEYTPMPDSDVQMNLYFHAQIAFDESSTVAAGKPVAPLLASIRDLIRDEVFPELEGFL